MPHSLSRRGFLQATGAGAFATLGAPPSLVPTPSAPQVIPPRADAGQLLTGWFDRPMRWVQLTLVENDPGRFDPQFWLDYFRRLHADAATLSAGGIVAYYPTEVPLHHRSAWLGDSRSVRHARRGLPRARHARRRAHRSACRRVTTCRRRIRTGSAVTSDRRAAAALGQPGPVGDVRARSLQLRVHGPGPSRDRHRCTRSTASSRTGGRRKAATATASTVRRTSRTATGRDLPRTTDRARSAAPAVSRVAQGAADRALEAVGRDRPRGQSRRALHPQRSAGPEDGRRAGGDSVHRQPGAARRDAAVGQRPARQGIPLGDGPSADRRHLQRRPRGAVSLEGLRAERAGDPALGRRGHGQRHASLGDEVLRRAVRPALAAGRRAHLRVALRARALPAQRGAARACRACCTRNRPRPTTPGVAQGDRHEDHMLGMYHALVESARAVRARARGLPHARSPRSVQAADPRRRGRAVRRAVRRDSSAMSERGGSLARDVRVLALRRGRPPPRRLRPRRRLRRVVRRAGSTARCRTRISSLDADPSTGADTRSSTDSKTRRASSTACSASTCAPTDGLPVAADAHSDVSRPADGGRLSARRAHRHARAVSARASARAASSTSRGTSTGRSGT